MYKKIVIGYFEAWILVVKWQFKSRKFATKDRERRKELSKFATQNRCRSNFHAKVFRRQANLFEIIRNINQLG